MLDSLLAFKVCLSLWQDIWCIESLRTASSLGHHHRRDKSKRAATIEVYKPELVDASKGRRNTSGLSTLSRGSSRVALSGTAGRWGSLGMSTR